MEVIFLSSPGLTTRLFRFLLSPLLPPDAAAKWLEMERSGITSQTHLRVLRRLRNRERRASTPLVAQAAADFLPGNADRAAIIEVTDAPAHLFLPSLLDAAVRRIFETRDKPPGIAERGMLRIIEATALSSGTSSNRSSAAQMASMNSSKASLRIRCLSAR